MGYRYYLSVDRAVNYPFGHGLSYAKLSCRSLTLSKTALGKGESLTASVRVFNASSYSAKKVVELYSEPLEEGNAFKPKRVLIAFKKVEIPAKSSVKVDFDIRFDDFRIYDSSSSGWKVEAGKVAIEVGESCQEIVLAEEIQIVSDDVIQSQRLKMPTYYSPTKDGFLQFDNDFEALYGRPIAMERDPKSKPYNLNSTFSDISRTWIGRQIFSIAAKKAHLNDPGHESDKAFFEQTPLRNVIMSGLGIKYSYLLRDLANGHFVSGIFAFLLGIHQD